MDWASFWAMGNHGFYVWLSYGCALLLFVLLAIEPLLRRKKLQQQLLRQYKREAMEKAANTYSTTILEQAGPEA